MLDIDFRQIPSNVEEDAGDLTDPKEIAKALALLKARDIAEKNPNDWVIGCDTLVVLPDGTISLKPESRDKAKWTLQQYSEAHCDVLSGLALVHKALGKELVGIETTRLYFHKFDDTTIDEYLDLNHWQGSSGSMTIEGEGGKLIKKVDGEYWNVVGLPVNLLKSFLEKVNLT